MSNQSKLATSEICQSCAKCCLEFWLLEPGRDFPLRLHWLTGFRSELIETDKGTLIKIKHPCKKLRRKAGKYFCEVHHGTIRPAFCETYPDNLRFEEWGVFADQCLILKAKKKEVLG